MTTRWTSRRRRVAVACAALGVAAAVLGAFVLRNPDAYRAIISGGSPASRTFFTAHSPTSIDRIDIRTASGGETTLRRQDRRWTIDTPTGPVPIRDDRAAALFASPDGKPEIVRWMQAALPPHEETPSRWEIPEITATFHSDGEEVESMMVGSMLPKGNLVRTEIRGRGDSRYFLVVGDLTDNFAGESALDWVPRRLFDGLDPNAIRSMRMEAAGGTAGWSAIRGLDGEWHVEAAGRSGPGRGDRVQRAANALAFLEADAFPASYDGGRVAEWTIAFRAEGKEGETVLHVGAETEPGSGLWLAWISDADPPRAIHRPLALVRDGTEFLAEDVALRAERTP